MKDIITGSTYTSTLTVADSNTAAAFGSGDLQVLGTPAMTALMENAAMHAIATFLETGESSVGVSLNVEHLRATAVGAIVSATAAVTGVEGRRIDFEITATDATKQTIGRGTHTRFVVNIEKFMGKIGK